MRTSPGKLGRGKNPRGEVWGRVDFIKTFHIRMEEGKAGRIALNGDREGEQVLRKKEKRSAER